MCGGDRALAQRVYDLVRDEIKRCNDAASRARARKCALAHGEDPDEACSKRAAPRLKPIPTPSDKADCENEVAN